MGERNNVEDLVKKVRVEPGKKVDLGDYPTCWDDSERYSFNGLQLSKDNADELLARSQKELVKMQEVLWADGRFALLIILQGMDAAGKDGLIKHVMAGVNPQGCQVTSFKTPTAEEAGHDFLWRCVKVLPEKGKIGIFNRSYYEEMLVVRVHPQFLENQRLPQKKVDEKFWEERFRSINDLERHLERSGTMIIKLFLNISKEEQRDRLLDRIKEPQKRWKFNPNDVQERDQWTQYMEAYRQVLERTSTEHVPWYVLPADQKWLSRVLASLIVTSEIKKLGLKYPEMSDAQMKDLEEARFKLM
jgi:PPK2 family polyphosphate:nucleotide phosphotransferase